MPTDAQGVLAHVGVSVWSLFATFVVTPLGFAVAWVVNRSVKRIDDIERTLNDFPKTYATRNDVNERLGRIEDKIDKLVQTLIER